MYEYFISYSYTTKHGNDGVGSDTFKLNKKLTGESYKEVIDYIKDYFGYKKLVPLCINLLNVYEESE